MTKQEAIKAIEWHNPRNRKEAVYKPKGIPIDDMRFELARYYESNPYEGYEQYLDDVELLAEDMERYVEDLTDKEVKERYIKFSAGGK